MKKTVFLGLLVIVLAFGFIGCGDGAGGSGGGGTVEIPTVLHGSWNRTGFLGGSSPGNVNLFFTATTTTITSTGAGDTNDNGIAVVTLTALSSWTVPAPYNVTYPTGYAATGSVTSSTTPNMPVGVTVTIKCGISSDGKTLATENGEVFTKQ